MSVEKSENPAFDSHRYVKRLVGVGMPEPQAEVLADERASLLNFNLATKRDIEMLRKDLETGLAEVRKELEVGLATVKADLTRWIAGAIIGLGGIMVAGFVGLAGIILNL